MIPLPAQADDLITLRNAGYRALLNIEPGGGKTALSAWAIEQSGASVTLIIAPKQTHTSAWAEDVKKAIGREVRVIGNDNKATKAALFDFEIGTPGIYACTNQFFTRSDVSGWSGDMLIVDEHHMLNSPGTKGQRKLSGMTPRESEEALCRRFPFLLALSGTSWRNSFVRAWATCRMLWPHLNQRGQIAHENHYMWLADRMDYEEVVTGVEWFEVTWEQYRDRGETWGKLIEGVPHLGDVQKTKKYLNEKEPGRLISEAPCVITHFRRQACCKHHQPVQLPDGSWTPGGFLPHAAPNVTNHVVALTTEQKRAIKELEDHYMTWLGDQPLSVDLTLTQQQRIRQLCLGVPTVTYVEDAEGDEKVNVDFDVDCKSPFYDAALDIIEGLPDEEPVVVFMESQRFARVMTEKLNRDGISAFEFSGATEKTREADKAEFGKKFRVAVVGLAAGGTGMSGLHYVSKTEIWMETSVDNVNNIQAEARVDRMGGRGQVDRHYIHDNQGRSQGRMSEALEKRRALAATLRKR